MTGEGESGGQRRCVCYSTIKQKFPELLGRVATAREPTGHANYGDGGLDVRWGTPSGGLEIGSHSQKEGGLVAAERVGRCGQVDSGVSERPLSMVDALVPTQRESL